MHALPHLHAQEGRRGGGGKSVRVSSGETALNNLTGVALTLLVDRPTNRPAKWNHGEIDWRERRARACGCLCGAGGLLSNYLIM